MDKQMMVSLERLHQEITEALSISKQAGKQEYKREVKKLKSIVGIDLISLLEESDAMIVGGAITSIFTNKEVNDVDIYFRDARSFEKTLALMFSKEYGYFSVTYMTDRSILVKDTSNETKIQLIAYKFFPTVQDVFNSFDFTINMGTYECGKDVMTLHPSFLVHNAQRYLEVNTNTDYPLISALRVEKYRERGYKISKPQMLALLVRIAMLEIDSWDDALDHVGGMYGIDPEKIFDRSKEFSKEEMILQLQELETIESNHINTNPGFGDLINKYGKHFSDEMTNVLQEKWNYRQTDVFLEIGTDKESIVGVPPIPNANAFPPVQPWPYPQRIKLYNEE